MDEPFLEQALSHWDLDGLLESWYGSGKLEIWRQRCLLFWAQKAKASHQSILETGMEDGGLKFFLGRKEEFQEHSGIWLDVGGLESSQDL